MLKKNSKFLLSGNLEKKIAEKVTEIFTSLKVLLLVFQTSRICKWIAMFGLAKENSKLLLYQELRKKIKREGT